MTSYEYDLILQGGHVIDPANDVDGIRDVAISGGRSSAAGPNLPAECVARYPELVVGTKTAHFIKPGWAAVDRAVEAGRLCGKPTMIDFRPQPERSYEDLILKHMRPGDIHTHMYAAHIPLLDESGRVQEFAWEARRRRVIFDVGHGAGSFWFRRAVPAVEHGFIPDSISTDMHKYSILIPQATMPLTMSKMLNIGMPLREVILRSTVTPAREINRPELGTLSP